MKTNFVIAILALVPAALSAGELVSLGNSNSPLLMALKASRQVTNGRELVQSIRKSIHVSEADHVDRATLERSALKTRLMRVDAVTADLSEVDLTDDDCAMVDAAHAAGVPVVLENASQQKMAKLLGIGTDADVVVTEFDPNAGRGRINFLRTDISNRTLEVVSHQKTLDTGEEVTKPIFSGQPFAHQETLRRSSFAYRLERTEGILRDRPFLKSNATRKDSASLNNTNNGTTGAAGIGNCDPSDFALHQCYEWETFGWNAYYVCPISIDTLVADCGWGTEIAPQLQFGLYMSQESGVPMKMVVFRATGQWGQTSFYSNDHYEVRPFFADYDLQLEPLSLPANYQIFQLAPSNANASSSVTTTTGYVYSAGASGTAGTGSFGYSSSSSTTTTLTDWTVTNTPNGQNAIWNYQLDHGTWCDKTATATYNNNPFNLMGWCLSNARYWVADLPGWSTAGNFQNAQPFGEAIWQGNNDTVGERMQFKYSITATIMDAEIITAGWLQGLQEFYQNTAKEDYIWSVDTGKVCPLGMAGTPCATTRN